MWTNTKLINTELNVQSRTKDIYFTLKLLYTLSVYIMALCSFPGVHLQTFKVQHVFSYQDRR